MTLIVGWVGVAQEWEGKVETLEGGNIDQTAAYFEKIPGLEFGKIKL